MARTYPKHTVTVCYDVVTEESVQDGATADNGFVAPDESHVSIGDRCRRNWYAARLRRVQAGEFDWRLRDAVRFLDNHGCGSYEGEQGQPFVKVQAGLPPYSQAPRLVASLHVSAPSDGYDVVMGRNGYEHGDSTSYSLHVSNLSVGSAARLRRLLERNGVRFH